MFTSQFQRLGKDLIRQFWLRPGTRRTVLIGPYRKLIFEITPQLRTRMKVFYTAYEPPVTSVLNEWLRPGMIIFNIGAHIGIHALYAARKVNPYGRVYAFEAFPENYRQLTEHARMNALDNLISIHKAVTSVTGNVAFTQGSSDGKHHLAEQNSGASFLVESITVDDFCRQQQVQPDLLLIDVEGAELQVLQGAQHILKKGRPKLILEHHNQQQSLSELLRDLGYKYIREDNRHIFGY